MILDKAFTTPPPRDVLQDIARARNSTPLPLIKTHSGVRLPPDRYCLSACNYKLRASVQPTKKIVKSMVDSRPTTIKSNIGKITTLNTGSPNVVKRPATQVPPKTQTVTMPKPVFKFSTNPKPTTSLKIEKVEMGDPLAISTTDFKRKREEDDYDV
jgi:transcription initiation factor TFIID subunit 9B